MNFHSRIGIIQKLKKEGSHTEKSHREKPASKDKK